MNKNRAHLLLKNELIRLFQRSYKKGVSTSIVIHCALLLFIGFSIGVEVDSVDPSELVKSAITVSALFLFILSLQFIQTLLFEFKDRDMLMSLPFTKDEIIYGKFGAYYIYDFISTLFLLLPLGIKLVTQGHGSIGSILMYILLILTLCFPSNLLAIGFAYFINKAKLSTKVKGYMQHLFALVVILLINFREELSFMHIPSAELMTPAIVYGNITNLFLYLALVLVSVFVIYKLIKKQFFTESTGSQRKEKRIFNQENHKIESQLKIFVKRERNRVFDIPAYFINAAFGLVLVLVLPVIFYFITKNIPVEEGEIQNLFDPTKTMAMIYIAIIIANLATVIINACTISLEGLELDSLKALPIKTKDLFISKIINSMEFMIVPSLISWIIGSAIYFHLPILQFFLGCLLIILASYTISCIYLYIDLTHANIHYDDVVRLAKSSSSPLLITLFMILHFILCIISATTLPINQALIIGCIVELIIGLIISYFVFNEGPDEFNKIS